MKFWENIFGQVLGKFGNLMIIVNHRLFAEGGFSRERWGEAGGLNNVYKIYLTSTTPRPGSESD